MSHAHKQSPELIRAMKPVVQEILGDPTEKRGDEWRYGSRGSLCIDVSKATWFNHETDEGGGILDFLRVQKNLMNGAAMDWLRERGHLPKQSSKTIVATYDYSNAAGELAFQVVRYDPKDFRQRRPDGKGGWIWKMAGVERVIYRLPGVIAAVEAGAIIYIVEGEKAANALAELGLTATCSPGGANKWRAEYARYLIAADAVVLPDNDDPGKSHAVMVADSLTDAKRVRVLALPGLPAKGDVADWIAAGGTVEELERLTNEMPDYQAEPKVESQEADDAHPIRLIPGELHTAVTAAEAAIIEAGEPIYQRGDTLVRPIVRDVAASRGRTTKAAGLGEQSAYALIDLLSKTAKFERFDGRAKDWVPVNPPMTVAQILLTRQGQWRFPSIAGVITCPTLKPDGSILTAPGYDSETRLYHVVDEEMSLHPELLNPDRGAAQRALQFLEKLLDEFPFVSVNSPGGKKQNVARSVALSALITPVVRGALSVAPLHAFRATTAGTGKSYLADVVSAISTGRPCPVISAAPDEAETEKRIAGLLLAGYPVVSIDNVNGELGGDLLCQAIERPLIRIRRLGGSDIIEIENAASLYATGNQMRVRGDMVRRTLVCDLDANVERPELRVFRSDPVAAVVADRGAYVSACLMIVRAYVVANKPEPRPSIASFRDWSDLVRSALVWLGCDDPALSMEAARNDDPELTELREMLGVWAEALGFDGLPAAEVVKRAGKQNLNGNNEPIGLKHPELREALLRLFGDRGNINTKRLGKWLMSREGRIVGGNKFVRSGTAQGGVIRWAVRGTT